MSNGAMFGTLTLGPNNGNGHLANHACITCKRQKRKCDKAIPVCGLCRRMNRPCDYSPTNPLPTPEEFQYLQQELARLSNIVDNGQALASPTVAGPAPQAFDAPPPDNHGQVAFAFHQYPAVAFLDNRAFTEQQVKVPVPNIAVPDDALRLFESGIHMYAFIDEYFNTIHEWFPIISKDRITKIPPPNLYGSDAQTYLLALSMILNVESIVGDVQSDFHSFYITTKHFLHLMESAGVVSLKVLQASVLINLYEYGHALYPAAYMTAAWSMRYAKVLDISSTPESSQMLKDTSSPTDQEERNRTWLGMMILDRLISAGVNKPMLTSGYPKEGDYLPVSDTAWKNQEIMDACRFSALDSCDLSVTGFPRLCQAAILMGWVLEHDYKGSSVLDTKALLLSLDRLCTEWIDEDPRTPEYFYGVTPTGLLIKALFTFSNAYLRPPRGPASEEIRSLLNGGMLKKTAERTAKLAKNVSPAAAAAAEALHMVSPIIMEGLYAAARYLASVVEASGDQGAEKELDTIRQCLGGHADRWGNAGQYLKILGDTSKFFQESSSTDQ